MSQRRMATSLLCGVAVAFGITSVSASPFDFFRRLGDSFAHPRHSPAPAKTTRSRSTKRGTPAPQPSALPAETVAPTKGGQTGAQAPSPPPSPVPEHRAATVADTQPTRADLPYGVPVPNRPGFVFSPFSPNGGYVDVRGVPSGTAVKDPYTGKLFLTP